MITHKMCVCVGQNDWSFFGLNCSQSIKYAYTIGFSYKSNLYSIFTNANGFTQVIFEL